MRVRVFSAPSAVARVLAADIARALKADPRLVLGMMSDIQKARMAHEAKVKAQRP